MRFYKVEDQIVISDKEISAGQQLIPNTTDAAGFQMHYLKPGMKPEAAFKTDERVIAAYEYCNLHGLWKAEV